MNQQIKRPEQRARLAHYYHEFDKENLDFNPSRCEAVAGEHRTRKEREGEQQQILKRFEDIDESWIRNYLIQVIVGTKINKDSVGRMTLPRQNRVPYGEEDEDYTVEAGDVKLESADSTLLEVDDAVRLLPVLLVRLYDKSVKFGVHLLSLLIGINRLTSKGTRVTATSLLCGTVYFMSNDGDIGRVAPPTANSSNKFPAAYQWCIKKEVDADTVFIDKFYEVLDILNIDLGQEDPLLFTKSYIEELRAKCIADGKTDIVDGAPVNPTVFGKLQAIREEAAAMNPNISDLRSRAESVFVVARDLVSPYRSNRSAPCSAESIKVFFKYLMMLDPSASMTTRERLRNTPKHLQVIIGDPDFRAPYDPKFLKTREGFFLDPKNDNEFLYIKVQTLYGDGTNSSVRAIMHSSGWLFTTQPGNVKCQNVVVLTEFIQDTLADREYQIKRHKALVSGKDIRAIATPSYNIYENNKKRGWWVDCSQLT